jgi:hypothetical protein
MQVQLSTEHDVFVWALSTSGSFSVKSMNLDYMNDHNKYLQKYIWKMKVPLKIKNFMRFLHRKVIYTKDNLAKRNWQGNKNVIFVTKMSQSNIFFSSTL